MPRSDASLRKHVRAALDECPDLDPFVVTVQVTEGVVTLSGELNSYAERLRAANLASAVPGVTNVDNRLTVRPYGAEWKMADEDIAKEVARTIAESELPTDDISFDVNQHVVTLCGQLRSPVERAKLRHAVESVRGVHFVENLVQVPQ